MSTIQDQKASEDTPEKGLCLVTVPIGNIQDITLRAIEALKRADIIFCEDTRVTRSLIALLGLKMKDDYQLIAFHEHTTDESMERYLNLIENNLCVLVSDAGDPYISDPAYPLVVRTKERGLNLTACSGISAPLVALALSAFRPLPFSFHGFLPRGDKNIASYCEKAFSSFGTHIFFESPHRVLSTLEVLSHHFPEYKICVARELTKKFESLYTFKLKNLDKNIALIKPKGEFVLLVEVTDLSQIERSTKNIPHEKELDTFLKSKRTQKDLAKLLSQLTGLKVKDLYQKLSFKIEKP